MAIRRVRTVFTGVAGAPYYSSLYFDDLVGGTQDLIDAVYDFWDDCKGVQVIPLAWEVDGEVQTIDPLTGSVISSDFGTSRAFTGQASGPVFFTGAQILLQTRTQFFSGGRELRGRIFIPGLASSVVGIEVPGTTATNQVLNAGVTLAGSTNANWIVWSRTYGTQADVISVNVPNEYAILRSRRD